MTTLHRAYSRRIDFLASSIRMILLSSFWAISISICWVIALPLPPRVRQILEWSIAQEVCFLNMDTPTSSAPNGPAYLLDLTLLPPSVHKGIQVFVHSDSFDSDHHLICIFSNNMIAPPRRCLTSVNWSRASVCLNNLLSSSEPTYVEFEEVYQHAIKSHRVVRSAQARSSPTLVGCHLLIFVAPEAQVF